MAEKVAVDDALFDELRGIRSLLASEHKVPPYIIFSDESLREMCQKLPQTDTELLTVKGVGENKLEKYGAYFLDALKKAEAVMG